MTDQHWDEDFEDSEKTRSRSVEKYVPDSGKTAGSSAGPYAGKKIVVIMGSPRKGNTSRACEEFQKHLQEICPAEFDYVWLKDAGIKPCTGCFVCFPRGEDKCPNRDDDIRIIEQKMLDADGVVFASPVYSWNVTGQMKTFIDRLSFTGHRPRFFKKKAFFLVTTGIMGADDVLKYLKTTAWAWGFECAGTAGLITPNGVVPRDRAEKNSRLLKKGAELFSAGLHRTTPLRPGIMDVIHFYSMRGNFSQTETVSPADYWYWKRQGWLSPETKWFQNVPLNPLYQLLGKIVEMYAERAFRNYTGQVVR
jgi:multimeric flavodoxin WrbA